MEKYFKHESAIIDNNVEIGEGTKIWHFSHIQSGAKIGKNCVLGQNGAGAIVTKDVPDYALVIGIPAKIVGWFSEAGEKMNFDKHGIYECKKSGKIHKYKNNLVREI